MQQKFWHNKTSNTVGILKIQLLCTCTTNAGLTRVRLRECISENIDMQICPNTPIVTFGLSKFQFIYIYSNSLCIKINYFTFEVGFGYMGILYIRPLHFPYKEKCFCIKPFFLFKSNTVLQTKYSWCWRSVLYTGYFGRYTWSCGDATNKRTGSWHRKDRSLQK